MEKQLDATQKLELEIQQLEDKLQVMTHMNGEKEKIFESNEELKQKLEEMESVDAMNQALLIKENLAKEELESARQMLIKVSVRFFYVLTVTWRVVNVSRFLSCPNMCKLVMV